MKSLHFYITSPENGFMHVTGREWEQ